MKKILSLMIAAALLLSAFLIFPLTTSAKDGKDIVSPESGQVFEVSDDVEIKIVTSHFKNDKDNYCEVRVYRIKDGLRVMERNLPYTGVGQTLSTTINAAEAGSFVIYISYYYSSDNGFIHYQDEDRNMYLLNGSIVHAHDAASFKVEDTTATESPATEPPATEAPTEEPTTEPPIPGYYEYTVLEDNTARITKYIGGDTEIVIPSTLDGYTVTELGDFAFHKCKRLKHIGIPDTVTQIGFLAFADCTSLEEITIPDSVTVLENKSFHECSSLKTVAIGNSLKKINNGLLADCPSLENIILGSSVEEFDSWAIVGCTSLTEFQVPATVITIRDHVFAECPNLQTLSVAEGNPVYDSRNNCNAVIETASNTLISGCLGTVIPKSVEHIGDYAFYGSTGLSDVKIPNSVTSIGEEAFYSCSGMKSVTIPSSVTSIGEKAFGYYMVDYVNIKMNDFTIYGCEGSEAERYANDNGFTFVPLSDEPKPLLGDADGSGEVDMADATVIQRAATLIAVPYDVEQLMSADVDGDEILTIVDATFIQRYSTRIAVPHPIGEPIE